MSGSVSATTLAYASLAMAAVGTGMSMYGQSQQAAAQENAAKYQAAVAANNAKIAQRNAQASIEQGQAQEAAQRQKTTNLVGAQRAAFAANGIDVGSGSALDVQSSAAQMGELDALTIRYNAENRAQGFASQAGGYSAQSGLYGMQGASAGAAGGIGMTTSLLGGAASMTDKWATFQRQGVLDNWADHGIAANGTSGGLPTF